MLFDVVECIGDAYDDPGAPMFEYALLLLKPVCSGRPPSTGDWFKLFPPEPER